MVLKMFSPGRLELQTIFPPDAPDRAKLSFQVKAILPVTGLALAAANPYIK
jgi:hypothetical protein